MRVAFFNQWCERVVATAFKAIKPPKPHLQQKQQKTDELKTEESELDVKVPSPPPVTPKTPDDVRIHPRSYWLPSFFFPQGFLTAVLQMHARKLGVSVDSLAFDFKLSPPQLVNQESLTDIKQELDVRELAYEVSSMCAS